MVVIRLARHGRKNFPFYKIVVSDSRFSVKKRFIERIGFFNPFSLVKEKKFNINIDRFQYWINKGAKPSDRTRNLISKFNSIDT
ncbi:30S ribosomal protein S16 [Buchnera aphidicola]|uniref:Small ribosomal subunit protein bS16 n=1 Tax=Buchnera aphidicola (Anoecia oenotherae) TaxID=1241833 RepID=A0A4D6Y0Q9_9GAMM|nr:30S ribosomal protein S16 [Buchnera aphidicola]QCI19431.1 30S ribosomal protein S16 [Buchnera aphidicola (Anoecia oenotherae)]